LSLSKYIFFICLIVPSLGMAQSFVMATDTSDETLLYITVRDSTRREVGSGYGVQVANSGAQVLSVSSHGYATHKIKVLPNENYTLKLSSNTFELNTVVVSDVHKVSTVSNSVLNINKISAKKIEQLGAFDLADALAFENNITLSRDNALGTKGIQLMGLGGDNVKILVDGVPVIGRFFGQLDLEQFNLENIKQVEVIQGPMSVIYGSNALAGTINLVNKQSNKSGATVLLNYESDGQYNISGTANKALKNGGLQLSAGRMFFNGWSENKVDRSYDWIPKEQYTASLGYRYRNKRNSYSWKTAVLQASLLDKGVPMAPYSERAIDQKFTNQRLDNTFTYNRDGNKADFNLTIANNHFHRTKNKYNKDLITLEEQIVPIAQEQDTQTFNATIVRGITTLKHWKGISTVVGVDGNYERGTGKRIKDNVQEQLDIATFLSIDKTIRDKLTVRIGSRYAYNSAFSTPLMYSIQTKYSLPKSQLIKIAYGRGFRAPSLKDLYLNFVDANHEVVGNENLKSENSQSITATYSKYQKLGKWSVNGTLDAFGNSISDKIELIVTSATAARYGNIGLYQSLGSTIGIVATNDKLNVRTSYSHTGIYNGVGTEDRRFIWTPQLVMQGGYTIAQTSTSVQFFFNRFGKISRVFEGQNGENIVRNQDAYSMLDVTVNQKLRQERLSITAGLRNLAGVTTLNSTETSSGAHTSGGSSVTISPGRTFFMSLRYAFDK
jgi:outer membrane receptor for ferrienterochelin and colicins